jgi:hypothetical protein
MFKKKEQNLILFVLILFAIAFTATSVLLIVRPKPDLALAQEGADGGTGESIKYIEFIQSGQTEQEVGGTTVTPPEIASDGSLIQPQSDDSGVEVVPIGAFRHNGDNANDWFHSFWNNYIRNDSGSQACLMAPTYPPDGANLTHFLISFKDDSATYNFDQITLRRLNLTTGSVNTLAGGSFGWNAPNPVEAYWVISSGTTVSKDYAYYVTLCFEPNSSTGVLFYGARLFYTLP